MAYYLQWSGNSGDSATNNETLELSGITGSLISVQYTVKSLPTTYTVNRYIFDIRRQVGNTADGGGVGYILQSNTSSFNTSGTSGFTKNGTSFTDESLFFKNYVEDDVFKFNVNTVPSGGAIAFGARYNEVEHCYGLAVSEIIITDDNGAHIIDMSDSGGTGASLTSTDGAITATLYNFPVDDSQWIPIVTAPTVAPSNVSGTLAGGGADLSWDAVSGATSYNIEFRRRA